MGTGTSYTQSNLSKSIGGGYNSEVEKLQGDLSCLGYSVSGIDGYFGNNTEAAVRLFQSKHGLDVDGVAGINTKTAIANEIASSSNRPTGNDGIPIDLRSKINQPTSPGYSTPSAGTNSTATVQSGSTGSAVRELQTNLINMGYDCGGYGADGDFGTGTYKSVRDFQRDYGLEQDGIVGPKTNQAIANALKTGSNGVPNYLMNKINSISTGKNIEWNNGVPKEIMDKINAAIVPKPDGVSIACAFFEGVAEGIVNGVGGVVDAITHPLDTANGLLFLMKAGKAGSEEQQLLLTIMGKTGQEVWNDFSEGNADKKAKMIGKVVGEIVFAVVGTKGITAGMDALKASAKTGKFSEIISKYSKKTKTLDEVIDDFDVPPVVDETLLLDKSKIFKELDGLNDNKISHLIEGSKNSEHQWEKLVPDKNWGDIKNIIGDVVYKNGTSKVKLINGELVQVTYKELSDGTIKIGDAWVK